MVVIFNEGEVGISTPVKTAPSHHLVLMTVVGPGLGPKLLVLDIDDGLATRRRTIPWPRFFFPLDEVGASLDQRHPQPITSLGMNSVLSDSCRNQASGGSASGHNEIVGFILWHASFY